VRVNQVEQLLSVCPMGGREDDDLKPFGDLLEEVLHVRALLHIDGIVNAIEVDLNKQATISMSINSIKMVT
jgi:hypothetical protein